MPHCSKCGTGVDAGAAFCQNCGASTGATATAPSVTMQMQTGLSENVAGLLCYSVGWITGLIFLLIDKRPFVRFHAAQSLITFGALNILSIAATGFLGADLIFRGPSDWAPLGFGTGIRSLIDIATFVVWIVGMIKAYQYERFRFPIVAEFADQIVGKQI